MKQFSSFKTIGGNGHNKLVFPVTFDIKIIIESIHPIEQSNAYLRAIFSQLRIPNSNWRTMHSAEGKYVSFTIQVDLKDNDLMQKLYSELKTIPGIKLAL
ncbi:MAG TPA: DUF493 family protein [Bacteroidales bacterium]|nr:DUF493 family protein [Bacteroidales bacterium]MBP7874890.1 DUF493 family protein [Bacteroidales bacterium]MCZ2282387.1 DUF493 domain-containing protein [Bacteroidales bacterium]HOG66534.1 DUF493 family protein [Bacteroidales bacterium]HPA12231.1 DUF493 family protein [Bacteroidales bacterium]